MAKKKEELLLPEGVNLDKLKDELTSYINIEIRKNFINEIDKSNKRLIKEKNKKILFRNFIIVILIVIIGLLLYIMYDNNYFDKYLKNNNKETITIETKKDKEEEKVKEPTLNELKNKYSYLLDNVFINEKSDYLNVYYNSELNNEIKNYLALNLINFKDLNKEDNYNIIESDTLKKAYEQIFNDTYNSKSFKYNGNDIRYITKLDSYITNTLLLEEKTNIKRIITDIKTNGEEIIISTIEYLLKDNKAYSILTNEEIVENSEDKIIANSDKFNRLSYTFKNNKLIKIEKQA